MSAHGDHGQRITHSLASIAENISNTAVALEASIAMFNADPGFGEEGIGLFLLLGQFVFGLPFLFAFPFEWDDDLCIADRKTLKTTVCTHGKVGCARELCFIHDFLVMYGAWSFLTHGQNALCFGMGDGDMLAGMTLLLARIVLLLLGLIFGTADGPLRPIGEDSQFFEFRKLLNDLFQGAAFRSFGAHMDFP